MIGLYYPFIHIRDENWLKLALIYWSKLARIVPEDYATRDSESVKQVQGELNAIISIPPTSAGPEVVTDFIEFVRQHAEQLRSKYGLMHLESWEPQYYTRINSPEHTDPRLSYIFHEKLGQELSDSLIHEDLASRGEHRDMRWIGVHPDIAAVYMTRMAESISDNTGYRMLADDLLRYVSIGGGGVEKLAQALLDGKFSPVPENFVTPETIAIIALRTVLPRDLTNVPIAKIIEFRQKYITELADFQEWIHSRAKKLNELTHGVTSPAAINEHLTVMEEQEIKPRLKQLEKQLKSIGLETVTGALSVKSPWNVTGAAAAFYFWNPAIVLGGIALTAVPNFGKQHREAEKLASGNYASYLMHAKERLTTRTLIQQVGAKSRELLLRV